MFDFSFSVLQLEISIRLIRPQRLRCYNTNANQNQGLSLVYHQFRRNCISPTRSVVYHQVAEDTR